MTKEAPLALIVAGGTGGHLYPGIAVARAIVARHSPWRVTFAVRRGDLGKNLLNREGFQVLEIAGQGWPRRLSVKTFTFAFYLGAGFRQAWAMLRQLKPSVVVGMGGYLSFPVIAAAKMQRIPTLIHEQNVVPGLANRILGRIVRSVAVSFPESRDNFPREKTWVSGLPIRPEIGRATSAEARSKLGLELDRLTILIFGGSLGAQRINEAALQAWPILEDLWPRFQVYHVTGEKSFKSVEERYARIKTRVVVVPYCHQMEAALAAADVVICRAGASTIAELLAAQKPALLVPFPFASENHQFYNATILVQRGIAEMILDADLTAERLSDYVRLFVQEPNRLLDMRRHFQSEEANAAYAAADRLAEFITKLHE